MSVATIKEGIKGANINVAIEKALLDLVEYTESLEKRLLKLEEIQNRSGFRRPNVYSN